MATILLGAAIFVLSACGLAVGLFFGREPLQGTCGRCVCGRTDMAEPDTPAKAENSS